MSALRTAADLLLDSRSPACLWRHPVQAVRVVLAIAGNLLLRLEAKLGPGGGRECPVCGWRGRHFRTFISADEIIPACICPGCGSFDRHRQLVLGVRDELARRKGWTPSVMIGFSLSTAMRFLLEHEGLARCYRTDIDAQDKRFSPDVVADLRAAPFGDGTVDWIFCSHVLEHIAELELCLDEIHRMLRPGGVAWLQVPLEPGRAHSRRIEIDPHRAHAHAWQFAPDFGSLIERPGWTVTEVLASAAVAPADRDRYGIDVEERFWLARKDG
ncbi:class I SAM-dependent methyltransferase [bacterium]|nr:class I SAM-dependent methyltransferase [bacterium]